MKKPEFIKVLRINKDTKRDKLINSKNIRRTVCLGLALAVFVTTANAYTVLATAEEEYAESEENLLTEVVMNETGDRAKEADKEETVYLITATG